MKLHRHRLGHPAISPTAPTGLRGLPLRRGQSEMSVVLQLLVRSVRWQILFQPQLAPALPRSEQFAGQRVRQPKSDKVNPTGRLPMRQPVIPFRHLLPWIEKMGFLHGEN